MTTKKEEFYRIAINITPNYCKEISYAVTISEPFEDFLRRNRDQYQNATFVLVSPCNREEYELYKKYNRGDTYVKFLKRDLSEEWKIRHPEEEEEEEEEDEICKNCDK